MTKVEYAVQWCISIANDNSHGYDWTHTTAKRWGPDYDCSSLIIQAYENAGVPVKQAGATRTYDMLAAFQKCGFIVVQGWNRQTGAGLIRGDVLLNVQNHTEICIGNGQLLKASSDYDRRQGDSSGNEIKIGGYYSFPWDYALRYSHQDEQYTGTATSFTTAFQYAQTGEYSINPDYTEINSYIVSVDRFTSSIDTDKLNELKVIAMFIEAGCLYDVSHVEVKNYVNPKLDVQVKTAKEGNITYGLFAYVRSRTVAEATEELKWLRIYIQKYVPPFGVWLKLEFTSSKATNDMIVAKYKDILERSGLKGKMGFYVTREQLDKISWDKWQGDFLLWLIDPVDDITDIEQILDPTFFDL